MDLISHGSWLSLISLTSPAGPLPFLDPGRDPFNQNSNRSDRQKWSTSKGGPVFSKLFRLDRTDPLSFGPKFPEILVEWIAPPVSCVVTELRNSTLVEKSFTSTPTARDWSLANCLSFTFFVFYLIIYFTYFRPPLSVSVWTGVNFERV